MNPETFTVRTLTDGGQSATEVAGWIAEFVGAARHTLELAQYDFNVGPETAAIIGGAIQQAAARGVAVRFVYNVDHRNPIPVPPPPEPDAELIAALGVPARPVAGVPDLMHHKYVIRDGESIWTGSLNWTDDSFAIQENVVAIVDSNRLAQAYTLDFDHLWASGTVGNGRVEPRPVDVAGRRVRPWFAPGFGDELSHRIAKRIGRARRVRVCSPVITSAPVLATLAQLVADDQVDVAGCLDATQVRGVVHQWWLNGNLSWNLPLLEQVLAAAFAAKPSTPWEPSGTPHDFMHAKVTVADDVVFVGSFNLSHSGELNAENVLEVEDPELADRLATYVDSVRALYPRLDAAWAAA